MRTFDGGQFEIAEAYVALFEFPPDESDRASGRYCYGIDGLCRGCEVKYCVTGLNIISAGKGE